MRPYPKPEPETAPVDRAKVRALLGEANAARERGEVMHQHPTLLALEKVCGSVVAYYVFAFVPNDHRLSSTRLDELADGLVRRAAP